jgi:hypothetical protein
MYNKEYKDNNYNQLKYLNINLVIKSTLCSEKKKLNYIN